MGYVFQLFLFKREERTVEDNNHWVIAGVISYNFMELYY